MSKKVSIVIPLYNSQKYIINTIDSILNQSYSNIEVIIINDGSVDNSMELIYNHYSKLLDSKIKIIEQNNFGAPLARNIGIKEATGDYIMFFDSDDILYKDAIKELIECISSNQADLVIGNFNNIDENNVVINNNVKLSPDLEDKKLNSMLSLPFPGNKLYNLQKIKNNKIYFDNVYIGQDLNFYLKYISCCEKICFVNSMICAYRIINNSISRTFNYNILDIIKSIDCVKRFYQINSKLEDLKYLDIVALLHYYIQLSKNHNYPLFYRKFIVKFFKNKIKCLNLDKSRFSDDINKYVKILLVKVKIKSSLIYYFYMKFNDKYSQYFHKEAISIGSN